LPEAGGQLLSNKLKEFVSHTRQFSKKKRILPNISGNSYSSSSEQIAESSKIRVKEDLLMQERSNNDTADVADVIDIARSKSNSSSLKHSNHDDFLPLEPSLDSSQIFSNQIVAITRKDTNVSESHDSEQVTSNQCNMLLSVPKLNSILTERNSEHMEKGSDISDISRSKSLITNLSLYKKNEQGIDKETSPRPSTTSTTCTMTMTMTTTATTTTTTTTMTSTMTTITTTTTTTPPTPTTTTTTTTMTTTTMMTKTTKTLVPYVSMLTHLKTPG